jgi:hypothetical protein
MPSISQTPERRRENIAETSRVDANGCWIWTGHVMPTGYGLSSLNARKEYAHRVSYTVHVGPIPDGLHIDHLCRVRLCVNPDHLEAVTQAVNNQRASAARTHCRSGHPLDGMRRNGTYFNRYCLTCNRARARAQGAARRAKR